MNPRGRLPGSKNKPKPPVMITRESANTLHAHILDEVGSRCDVFDSVASYAWRRQREICILSGNDTVTNRGKLKGDGEHGGLEDLQEGGQLEVDGEGVKQVEEGGQSEDDGEGGKQVKEGSQLEDGYDFELKKVDDDNDSEFELEHVHDDNDSECESLS
ncbi:AT-hook motif nuclear-localized protein [Vigna angularis]|uniref:AT-hook motif nuclear-localized protein n=1 Tax=Phaseolus angularis TaxID=3914 RepID=A0A8T0JLE5_PHAAN|nr:AT-hook motif nuclear-localized protein [Vigna angularis]